MESTISECSAKVAQEVHRPNVINVLHISTTKKELLNNENSIRKLKSPVFPSLLKIPKLNLNNSLVSPSELSDEASHSVSSSTSQGHKEHIDRIVSPKLDRLSMYTRFKNWMKSPLNMAIFLWITCVAVSGAILFLVMTGMLNHRLPKKSQRDIWFETNNQILNALFTLTCLYQHPNRFFHLFLLCRWKPNDTSILRNLYCKNGTRKPHERAHISTVVTLLHLNCFAQYALCGLNLGYKRTKRPSVGVGISLSLAIAAPAIALRYFPLNTPCSTYATTFLSLVFPSSAAFASSVGTWRGSGLETSTSTSRLFSSCTAPVWIFYLAAKNIDHKAIKEAFGITGSVLCAFGLLYGGFWRVQMRKKFGLTANRYKPMVADCATWLFSCCCSLAQEVRTADFLVNKNDVSLVITNGHDLSDFPKENSLDELMKPPILISTAERS